MGPVVFYRGFTQEFVEGQTKSTETMLEELREAVDKISYGKRLTIIDGVGYPGVRLHLASLQLKVTRGEASTATPLRREASTADALCALRWALSWAYATRRARTQAALPC